MYDTLYPKKASRFDPLFSQCETCMKITVRAILYFIIFGFGAYFTVNYFTEAYAVSSSIRASMPSMGLFHVFNLLFWATLFFAFICTVEPN